MAHLVTVNAGPSPSTDPTVHLFKSTSAPNTPRSIFEEPTAEELGKDLQLQMLREKLEFTEKQLEEKDKQLDHYKQLVKTLKDVLAEVSNRRNHQPPIAAPQVQQPAPGTFLLLDSIPSFGFHSLVFLVL
jgi:hypothetical protein